MTLTSGVCKEVNMLECACYGVLRSGNMLQRYLHCYNWYCTWFWLMNGVIASSMFLYLLLRSGLTSPAVVDLLQLWLMVVNWKRKRDMNDHTDVETSKCKNLQPQKSVSLSAEVNSKVVFKQCAYIAIIQYDAGCFNPKGFVN